MKTRLTQIAGILSIAAAALVLGSTNASAQAIHVPKPGASYPGRPANQHVWQQDFTTLNGTHVHRELVLGPLGFVRQRHLDLASPPYAPPQYYHKDAYQSPLGTVKRKTISITPPGAGLPPSGPNEFYRAH